MVRRAPAPTDPRYKGVYLRDVRGRTRFLRVKRESLKHFVRVDGIYQRDYPPPPPPPHGDDKPKVRPSEQRWYAVIVGHADYAVGERRDGGPEVRIELIATGAEIETVQEVMKAYLQGFITRRQVLGEAELHRVDDADSKLIKLSVMFRNKAHRVESKRLLRKLEDSFR